MKALPRGATPIDFAYAIHTDVGHTCVGVRINGRMVPLRTRLQSGDIVEIVTSGTHKPSRDWLNLVTTTRARNKIKHFIAVEEKARAVDLGRRLLEKEVRRLGLSTKAVLDSSKLDDIASNFAVKKGEDVLAALGYGKASLQRVWSAWFPASSLASALRRARSRRWSGACSAAVTTRSRCGVSTT